MKINMTSIFRSVILKATVVIFIFFSGLATTQAQLTVNTGLTIQDLVQNVLLGPGITVSNIQYSGDPGTIGAFSTGATPTNLGLTSGIIMSSGLVNGTPAIGSSVVNFASTDNNSGTDADLQALTANTVEDAAILQFDFVPTSDTMRFSYVFASEEYPEFVNQSVNDVFGFFISGANPAGGNFTNVNLALIPGTTSAVSIDNINGGSYPQFYIDNEGINGNSIVYDGFTTVFTAWSLVVPCTQYHIKMAICDAGDGIYDSGVFLMANSFTSTSAVTLQSFGSTSDSLMVEGCGNGDFLFVRHSNIANVDTIQLLIGGSATNGVDYVDVATNGPVQNFIIFPAGEDTIILSINPVQDGINESLESITLGIPQVQSCTEDTIKAKIYIINVEPLVVTTAGDTTICSQTGESATISCSHTGGYGPFSYLWSPGMQNTTSVTVAPEQLTTYTIEVTDSCGTKTVGQNITVVILCELEVPDIITPNGDGSNDLLIIENLEQYPNSILQIFDRWGRKVYESIDYQNDWNGGTLAVGTYFYVLTRNDEKSYHGTLTILR